MNIISFIKSLLPRFSKSRVIEDSRMIRNELETATIPSYIEAEKHLKNWKFGNQATLDMITIFNRNSKSEKGDNIIVSVRKGLEKMIKTHAFIEGKLEEILEEEIVTSGISCLKANLIRCIETISFVSIYSMKLLNYIYILETSHLKSDDRYVRDALSPAEISDMEKNFINFCISFAILSKTEVEFKKIINAIPDIVISPVNGEAVHTTLGDNKLDPTGLSGIAGGTINPIYHIGLMVAEIQANSYKRSRDTKKVLELRLMNLQLLNEQNPDAKLEREIEYIQSRIQGLDHKIKKMEESAS